MFLEKWLNWARHILKVKRLLLNQRQKDLYFLLDKKPTLKLENKLILYKTLLMPIWSCGIRMWEASNPSKLQKIPSFQSITFWSIHRHHIQIPRECLRSRLLPTIQTSSEILIQIISPEIHLARHLTQRRHKSKQTTK